MNLLLELAELVKIRHSRGNLYAIQFPSTKECIACWHSLGIKQEPTFDDMVKAQGIFWEMWPRIRSCLEATRLSAIPVRRPIKGVPVIDVETCMVIPTRRAVSGVH